MVLTPNTHKIVISGKQCSIIRRFFFKRLGISPNYNSRHKLGQLFQLLLYMFVNQLSAEEASSQLKIECSDAIIASADTLLRRLKQTNAKLLRKAFNSTVSRMLKGNSKKRRIIAIDYHDIPYYGDKNNPHVKGTKRQRGTNYCHQFATLEIVDGDCRLTLAVRKLSVDDDSKATVIEELTRVARKHAQIACTLADRAFYNVACIRALKLLRVKFVIAVPKDKAIKRVIKEHANKLPTVVQHSIGRKEAETFNLCMIHGKQKDPTKPRPIHCFATNIATDDAHYIKELYRKRWSIETGYKTKKKFRAKTSTINNVVRMLYFYMECLLYNAWYNVRNVAATTIATFKKVIEKLAVTSLASPDRTDT